MRRTSLHISLILVLATILFSQTGHRSGTTAAQFLSFSMGADYSVSGPIPKSSGSLNRWVWNPAFLGEHVGTAFSVTQADVFLGQFYSNASIAANYPGLGSLGAQILVYNSGELDVTTLEDPWGTGNTFTYQASMLAVAFGKRVLEDVSIGVSPKLINESTYDLNASTLTVDLGLVFDTNILSSRLLIGLKNLGGSMRMNGTPLSTKEDSELSTRSWELPVERQVGWAVSLVGQKDAIITAPFMDVELGVGLSDFADRPAVLTGSIESQLANLLIFRYGYHLQHELIAHSLGAGLRFSLPSRGISRIDLDYAFIPWDHFGTINQFSLGVAW